IFFDLAQRLFIQIPLGVGILCLLLLLVAFAALAWRRGSLIRGGGVAVVALLAAGASAWAALEIIGLIRSGTYWRADPELTFVAAYATALLAELAVFRTAGAGIEARALRAAYWFLFLLLGALLAFVAPGGIIYFLIPPAAVLLGTVLSRWFAPAEVIGGVAG